MIPHTAEELTAVLPDQRGLARLDFKIAWLDFTLAALSAAVQIWIVKPVAIIEILGWKEFRGGTAWDARIKSELRKRLRSGVSLSQHEIKRIARQIEASEILTLQHVREEAVLSVTQILRALGAEMHVTLGESNERLFKKWPPSKRRPESPTGV